AAARRNGRLQLTVRDDGPGVAAGARDGIGLSNTRARLQQQYGARHTFSLASNRDGGTIASLEIPA
ncbi:MAG TPA: sensor histidine kinase, partial [Thermoanaerobaculia bacterium]|nr:sensor histidine kinase [Thermoanaerobaculia bacterium]